MSALLTLAVAAGKGGTGKTLVATSLAQALARAGLPVRALDCDVEEPNTELLLRPRFSSRQAVNILVPQVDAQRCSHCGLCARTCQVSAIAAVRGAVLTFHELCSGCGACTIVCPTGAISEVPLTVGEVASGTTAEGIAVHVGRLTVGHQRSGPVTRAVKRHLSADRVNIIDAPPGTACPMQAAVADSDFCLLVTEPTPFGLANLREAVDTCRRLDVPCGVLVNRWRRDWAELDQYLAAKGLRMLLRIPERRDIAEAYARGETLLRADPSWAKELVQMYELLQASCGTGVC